MKFAILTFPGTNCERDLFYAITNVLGQSAKYVRHDEECESALDNFDTVLLPGGSSYSDMPRPGAKAATANIILALHKANDQGKTILGICNGFQILIEAGLLPGRLLFNNSFICKDTPIKVATDKSRFTNEYKAGQIIKYPIAHAHGNYQCSLDELQKLQQNSQILFTYENNPNGSIADIAGITNKKGNVLGMMPHPERAMEEVFNNIDGLGLFKSILS